MAGGLSGNVIQVMVEILIVVALLGTGFQHITVANATAIETTLYGLVPMILAIGVFYHIARQFNLFG
jgi:hypothetical protein